jgi:hypothetical protein
MPFIQRFASREIGGIFLRKYLTGERKRQQHAATHPSKLRLYQLDGHRPICVSFRLMPLRRLSGKSPRNFKDR